MTKKNRIKSMPGFKFMPNSCVTREQRAQAVISSATWRLEEEGFSESEIEGALEWRMKTNPGKWR